MKKVFEVLDNIMKINACKEKIKRVIDTYPENTNDEDFTIHDLDILIENMEMIISINKKQRCVISEDVECLNELQRVKSTKQEALKLLSNA